ncbi:ABC transporter ATP-binding protein [Sporosarcina sp. SAFN-010]|uniref:ABC transporter ATP-binding protein n=1 Tax=Sporosarcina sp. SAFN-010 TaxID=3387273 RepID=UPI003F7D81D5
MTLIKLENITKTFNGEPIFVNFNLEIDKGEFLGIAGRSGAGKSTLLNIIGLLEDCEGTVSIKGKTIDNINSKEARLVLKNDIGYLFQNYALIDDLTVYENLTIIFDKTPKKERRALALRELSKLGLGDVLDKKIYQLSGGEQQRVAMARLILRDSEIILADEPTGSLDKKNGAIIMSLLKELHMQGKTIIMVSHDENAILNCTRVINL